MELACDFEGELALSVFEFAWLAGFEIGFFSQLSDLLLIKEGGQPGRCCVKDLDAMPFCFFGNEIAFLVDPSGFDIEVLA